MINQVFTLSLKHGLHARPAGLLVKTVGPLACEITLKHGDKEVNGKSLMALLSSGFASGSEIDIRCDGPDESEAMARLEELFATNFNEEEAV